MGLREYHQKRDFKQTAEPSGKEKAIRRKARSSGSQTPAASRLHYDCRRDMEAVLKSWSAPKGMPFKKGERRLGSHVEDQALECGGFEGRIPRGNYGAGTV